MDSKWGYVQKHAQNCVNKTRPMVIFGSKTSNETRRSSRSELLDEELQAIYSIKPHFTDITLTRGVAKSTGTEILQHPAL